MKEASNPDPDSTAAHSEARVRKAHELHEGEKIERSITILKPAAELFSFWRDFSHLPRFMKHLDSIRVLSPSHSHWTWKSVGGITLEWEAEVIAEIQDRMISWQTLPNTHVNQAGSVWFKPAPQDEATEVHVQLIYRMPGGKITKRIAEIFGEEPSQILREDLRRLKWLMETGEIPTTHGQSHGTEGILH